MIRYHKDMCMSHHALSSMLATYSYVTICGMAVIILLAAVIILTAGLTELIKEYAELGCQSILLIYSWYGFALFTLCACSLEQY